MEYLPVQNHIRHTPHKKSYLNDESPHFDRTVEWWFVQGYYGSSGFGRRDFMVSFFRQKVPQDVKEIDGDIFHVVIAIYDPVRKECRRKMIAHKKALESMARYGPKQNKTVDSSLVRAYLNEILTYGPAADIVISETPVTISGTPLTYRWDGFELVQKDGTFLLYFPDLFTGIRCGLELTPGYASLDLKQMNVTNSDDMAYRCYPRMDVRGTDGKEQLRGEAWFDHQFGEYQDTFLTQKNEHVLGWDWIALNLDDGTDGIFMAHREMNTGMIKNISLVLKKSGEEAVLFKEVQATPLGYWESPKTHIVWPVKWRIEVPSSNIDFTFTPAYDDQEIMYLGLMRAIWEGSGNITGSFSGIHIQGRGRLELYGYGYITDIKNYMDHFIKRFDRHIEEFFPQNIDEDWLCRYLGKPLWQHDPQAYRSVLTRPVWDLMQRKGKHWRTVFGVLFLDSLGYPSGKYEALLATALELNHTGALIIDDIEDNSLLRRGDTSIHLKYGTDIAINAGNTLYFLPYVQLWDHPHLDQDQKYELYRIMVKVWTRSHFGQGADIYWSRNLSRENLDAWLADSLPEKILQMYSYKTAAAVEGVGESVCVIARTDDATKEAYMSLGRIFGTAFQIIDDINNFNDSKEWRKTCGEDLARGKLTYVIVQALTLLDAEKRKRLTDILLSETERTSPDSFAEGIRLIRTSGALELCRTQAQKMIEDQWKQFSRHADPSDAKTMIRMLIWRLTNIVYES
ncbi:MAG: polyprenyl synthetase family protein [Candidatus Omnitrophica bacterium]|nr:polyprenyl synthetase family protein [Candidatus Omnitrophota bacterium]